MLNFLADERLYEWLTYMLTDKTFPLTLNSIAFVLDLSRRLNIDSPKDAKISSVTSLLCAKVPVSRKQLAKILSEVIYIFELSRNFLFQNKFSRRRSRAGFQCTGRPRFQMSLIRTKNLQTSQSRRRGACLRRKAS